MVSRQTLPSIATTVQRDKTKKSQNHLTLALAPVISSMRIRISSDTMQNAFAQNAFFE